MAGRKPPRIELGKIEPMVSAVAEAVDAMPDWSRLEIGRKTYNFVQRCMEDPVLRERIRTRAEALRKIAAGSSSTNG